MTKQNKFNFATVYNIILSISIILAGIFLILGCIHIFFSGEGYSRQIVSETFAKICLPIYICVILLIGSFIVNFFNKNTNGKSKFIKIKNFKQNAPKKLSTKKALIIKTSILAIGILIFVFGIFTGGFKDVLTKAINICTECIGLG